MRTLNATIVGFKDGACTYVVKEKKEVFNYEKGQDLLLVRKNLEQLLAFQNPKKFVIVSLSLFLV